MKIAKTLSALSLAFALQAGALVAATVVLSPSDAVAAVSKKKAQKKVQKKTQKKAQKKTHANLPNPGDPVDRAKPDPRDDQWEVPKFPKPRDPRFPPGDDCDRQFKNCR